MYLCLLRYDVHFSGICTARFIMFSSYGSRFQLPWCLCIILLWLVIMLVEMIGKTGFPFSMSISDCIKVIRKLILLENILIKLISMISLWQNRWLCFIKEETVSYFFYYGFPSSVEGEGMHLFCFCDILQNLYDIKLPVSSLNAQCTVSYFTCLRNLIFWIYKWKCRSDKYANSDFSKSIRRSAHTNVNDTKV